MNTILDHFLRPTGLSPEGERGASAPETFVALPALVGIAELQRRLDVDEPMGNPRWPPTDERSGIAWRQWLNMVDGQQYVELAAPSVTASDAAKMLFGAGRLDAAAFAASLPLIHPPGSVWNYNSAGFILVCDALTRLVAGASASPEERRARMSAWMRESLFAPIGMRSAQPEFDAQGVFVGSSFVYATARDFAIDQDTSRLSGPKPSA